MTHNLNSQHSVVLLHPAGANGRAWWRVREGLEATMTVHTPNYVQLACRSGTVPTFTALTKQMIDWADEHHLEQFILGGISMGGMLAQHVAAVHPDRVAGLVIGNTGYLQSAAQQQLLRQRAENLHQDFPGYVATTVARWFDEAYTRCHSVEVQQVHDILTSVPVSEHRFAWELIATLDTTGLLARISAPTLVIGGSNDRSTPLTTQGEIAQRIPNAHLVTVAAGHMSCVESPTIWVDAINTLNSHTEAQPQIPHRGAASDKQKEVIA